MELPRRLKELFQQLFVQPGRLGGGEGVDAVGLEVVAKMKVRLQQELMDYHDYLSVKAQRNITMTSYPFFAPRLSFFCLSRCPSSLLLPILLSILSCFFFLSISFPSLSFFPTCLLLLLIVFIPRYSLLSSRLTALACDFT